MIAFQALSKSRIPFKSYAQNDDCMMISGSPYCPDFLCYKRILVEVDGFFTHSKPRVMRRDSNLVADIMSHNLTHRNWLFLLRFGTEEVESDVKKNFINKIQAFAKKKGLTK